MTAAKEPSGRTLYFVDAAGGALSVLAASVARSLGMDATAATTLSSANVPGEIAKVLEEVGMRVSDAAAEPFDVSASASKREIIFLGAKAPPELTERPAWDVALYEGEGELERLSAARIARDQVERRLEGSRSSS